ncbi:MAG: hypothetical protein LUE26_00220 [Alistipes sp.]|nr:hypothetical protein [Alistipes sp.]
MINFLSGLATGIAVRAAGIAGLCATYRPADNPPAGWTSLPAGDPAHRDSKVFLATRTAGVTDPARRDLKAFPATRTASVYDPGHRDSKTFIATHTAGVPNPGHRDSKAFLATRAAGLPDPAEPIKDSPKV